MACVVNVALMMMSMPSLEKITEDILKHLLSGDVPWVEVAGIPPSFPHTIDIVTKDNSGPIAITIERIR